MTKKAIFLPWDVFLDDMEVLPECDLYVDEAAAKEIVEFLSSTDQVKNRFRKIALALVTGNITKDLYGPEEVSAKAKNMKAMKFKGANRLNPRIYCKEFYEGGRKIVMIYYLRHKATQKVDKKLKTKIEAIGEYEYEFIRLK